jgi:hypothetical protein
MKNMLINLSNHPSANWSNNQIKAAEEQFGKIMDLPFPDVNPKGNETYIQQLVQQYLQQILHFVQNDGHPLPAIHIMGELTFTFAMVKALQAKGITCVASTTKRIAKEENGVKTSEFKFVQFRKYK